jgi:signal transduction histidine kinase
MSAAPVRGPDGVIIAAAGVVEDITGLRAQEAEQQRLREEERLAKAAAKAQADFIANMNHELRTPGGVFAFEGMSSVAWLSVKSIPAYSPRNTRALRATDAVHLSG